MKMIKKSVKDPERFTRVWERLIVNLNGSYEMNS